MIKKLINDTKNNNGIVCNILFKIYIIICIGSFVVGLENPTYLSMYISSKLYVTPAKGEGKMFLNFFLMARTLIGEYK